MRKEKEDIYKERRERAESGEKRRKAEMLRAYFATSVMQGGSV